MRHFTLSAITFCVALFSSTSLIQAAERSVSIDGITYYVNLDDETHSTAYVSTSDKGITNANILPEVKIGDATYTVTKIGNGAFCGDLFGVSFRLKNVTIPTTIKVIEDFAFDLNSKYNPINIHEGLKKVGHFSEINCYKNLIIPNSLKEYNDYGFIGYEIVTIKDLSSFCNLECHYADSSGAILYDRPLYLNGKLLTEVVIPSEINTINQFSGCSSIEYVNTNKAYLIKFKAFESCKSLRVAIIGMSSIGNEVEIEEEAFNDCEKLEYVELGENVTKIEQKAFANLKSLEKVLCHSFIPPSINKYAFLNSYPSWSTLYVPVGAKEAYKSDPVWGQFGEIIEGFEGAGINDISVDNNTPIEYYDLNGIQVDAPGHGVYIRKQGSTAKKVIL